MCLEGTTPQDMCPEPIMLASVQFVGNNSFVAYCARKRQLQVVSSCPRCRHIKQPLIALVTISATDPVAIQSIETIRVNPCNSWAKKQLVGKKNYDQFNQQIHFVPQQSSSTTPQNSPADNQNQQHSSSGHNNTWQTSC